MMKYILFQDGSPGGRILIWSDKRSVGAAEPGSWTDMHAMLNGAYKPIKKRQRLPDEVSHSHGFYAFDNVEDLWIHVTMEMAR